MTDLERAVKLLRAGKLVAIPTETVYGLGADASNPQAVRRIFAAKGRPADHPLIVHVPDSSHLERWAADVPDAARRLALSFWPGPLTLILKRQPSVADVVTGGQSSVGLRVPDHPMALDLLRQFDGGIAAPSANRFGRISPTCADHVRAELGDAVALVLDGGPCRVGIESTIVDFSCDLPRILRPGEISLSQLVAVAGADIRAFDEPGLKSGNVPRVSGSLDAHYAPQTPLCLIAAGDLVSFLASVRGRHIAVMSPRPDMHIPDVLWHQMPAQSTVYAHDLYAVLRALDAGSAELIVVERLPAAPEWQAICDRLGRAAAGSGHRG